MHDSTRLADGASAATGGDGGDGDEGDEGEADSPLDLSQCQEGPLTVSPATTLLSAPSQCDTARLEGAGLAREAEVSLGSFCDVLEVVLPDAASAPEVVALFPDADCQVSRGAATCMTRCLIPAEDESRTISEATYDRLCTALQVDPQARVACTILE